MGYADDTDTVLLKCCIPADTTAYHFTIPFFPDILFLCVLVRLVCRHYSPFIDNAPHMADSIYNEKSQIGHRFKKRALHTRRALFYFLMQSYNY